MLKFNGLAEIALIALVLQPSVSFAQKPTILEKRCNRSNSVCTFLGENYDEMRARCGLLVSNRWWPKYWFKPYRQVDAVPATVLYGIDESAFLDNTPWVQTGRNSMIRLLSYVGDPATPLTATDFPDFEGAESAGKTLHFDPLISPDIALVAGETSVVHTMSCSDVFAAAQSAKVGISVASANQKITARDTTSNSYKLVYGLFRSPMAVLKTSASSRQAYYFETAEWYLRQLRPRAPGGSVAYPDSPSQPSYVAAARAVVVYDEFTDVSALSTNISGSGQYSTVVAVSYTHLQRKF